MKLRHWRNVGRLLALRRILLRPGKGKVEVLMGIEDYCFNLWKNMAVHIYFLCILGWRESLLKEIVIKCGVI